MTTLADLKARIDVIEETYEFSLGYAAQGLDGDEGSKSGEQLRGFLRKADEAISRLADDVRSLVEAESLEPKDAFHAYADVIEQDARTVGAAVRLVLAQPSISSQLVDNLNGSVHLKALLMDLFLIDEILKRALARSR